VPVEAFLADRRQAGIAALHVPRPPLHA
jgi:hypothetical protein